MSETRAVVEEFYRRLGDGEIEELLELLAEEIDWDIYGAEEVPWTGRRSTRAEAAEFFRSLPEHLRLEAFTVSRIVAEGADAVALGHMRHTVKATGKVFASPFAFHLTVEDGKITRYVTFEDSLALARAFEAV
ncbi:nuclear transport factor 2 family protein [Streptomyces sp. NPDC048650]|uniref:nuclear transport factor 2 family protein n=1 Tax=unclassified Streptomyces TaxID=2593676 RepID=UPI0037152E25